MSQLRIYLLGRFQAFVGEKQLTGFESKTAESLFAYLVTYRDQPHPREVLVGNFWPEDDEKRARKKLREAVYRIRESLRSAGLSRENYILKQDQNLQFNPKSSYWLDIQEFEQLIAQGSQTKNAQLLKQAVELYRGPFLEGFYEDWIITEQSRLNDLYLKTLDTLIRYHEECEEYDEAIRYAQRSLALNPLQDQLHFKLMQLLVRIGNRNAALKQYEVYCHMLEEELPDAEPLPEITEFINTVRQQKKIEIRIQQFARGYARLATPFEGRGVELEILLEFWQRARAGTGGLVLVEGEAGIGKTRLIQEFLRIVRESGGLALIGRCYQAHEGLLYQPLIEALRGHFEQSGAISDLAEKVPRVWLRELVKLLPEFAEKLKVEATPPLTGEKERNRLYEGLTQVLLGLSRDWPVVLFLDDLHWSDAATMAYLEYLIRRLPQSKLLMVGTYRVEEMDNQPTLLDIRTRILREEIGRILRLEPLPAPEVQRLVEGMLQSREIAVQLGDKLYQESRGNPLFLVERVKTLAAEGALSLTEDQQWQLDAERLRESAIPSTVEDVILSRLRRVERGAQEACKLLAVIGRPADLELLVEADGKDESAMLEHILNLQQKHLVGEDPQGYRFTHHLIGSVIYQHLGEGQRSYLHRRIAETLETIYSDRLDIVAGELAHHFSLGQRWTKALSYRLKAAELAVRSYATMAAFTHLERAQEIVNQLQRMGRSPQEVAVGRFEILRNRGNIHWNTGEYEQARQSWEEALQIAKEIDDKGRMGKAYGNLALLCWTLGQHEQAQEYHQESLELFKEVGDKRGMSLTLNNIGALYWSRGDYEQARKYWQDALQIVKAIGDLRVKGMCLGNIALVHHTLGEYKQAKKAFQQSMAIAQEIGDKYQIALNLSSIGLVHCAMGEYEQAHDCQQQALQLFREIDDKRQVSETLQNLAQVKMELKQYDTALQCLQEARQTAEQLQLQALMVQSMALEAKIQLAMGQSHLALQSSKMAVEFLKNVQGVEAPHKVYFIHSQVLRAVGQESAARSYLQKAFEIVQQQAKRIQDEAVRQSFLTQVEENRAIIEQWEQIRSSS